MPASILSIATAVPPTRLAQGRVRDLFAAQDVMDRRARRLVQAAFDASGIESRHTVLAELDDGVGRDGAMPVTDGAGQLLFPTTAARNDVYIREAPGLCAAAAASAIEDAGVDRADITHVVTVSCTGMYAPGPDHSLVRDLGLSPRVERYHLGFIGCAAALPGLRVATRLCEAQPGAVVLVVCAELCTLHFRADPDPQQIVAASVFSDGAAAAVVTADPSRQRGTRGGIRLDIDRFGTTLTSEGEQDMVWVVGDHGFEMTLSAEVPRIIGREIRGAVDGFVAGDRVDVWAVHPGGRSVLDRVESGLELDPDALAASRTVLREHGNMSSATILFILQAQMADAALGDDARIAALAFGPGLTVESALLTKRIEA